MAPRDAGQIRSFVVSGGARGIGRAIVEAMVASGDGAVAFDRPGSGLSWARDHPAYDRLVACEGDAMSIGQPAAVAATEVARPSAMTRRRGSPGALPEIQAEQGGRR